jgi:hypothetical protein
MIGTLLLTGALCAAIYVTRAHAGLVRSAWRSARWYERCALLACLLPIPGPFDEIAGALLLRRIAARV